MYNFLRYKRHKEQAVQQYGTLSMSMAPPRPNSGYESSEDDPAPRYETQVTLCSKYLVYFTLCLGNYDVPDIRFFSRCPFTDPTFLIPFQTTLELTSP